MADRELKKRSPLRDACAIALVLFGLYAFSIGPAHLWAYRRGDVHSYALLNRVYGPLFWITDNSGTDGLVDWWVHLWVS